MKLLRLHIVRLLLMALIVLPAVTSCYNYDQEENVVYSDASANYINITISVSASDNAITRAMPNGGEYGDGTEEANARENHINNITLIFYQDGTINTDAEVKCVKSYVVRPITDTDLQTDYEHSHKTGETTTAQGQEVLYTTGNQKLDASLQLGETYKLLVVANGFVDVNVGERISVVRDRLAAEVFKGTGIGIDATDFVMTSESEAEVTLANPAKEITSSETSFIYYFPCIHIERLAARIDFDTTGGTYYEDTTNPTKNGYKYVMGGNIFVLTSVTPFNLYDEDEYLFKRVQDAWPATATTYLGDETTVEHTTLTKVANNYVVGFKTGDKDNDLTNHPFSYLSPIAVSMSNAYSHPTTTDQGSTFTLCYAKENTLMPTSHLKKYATGIAFTGEYYSSGIDGPHQTRTYYHYIRHQGDKTDADTYKAKQWSELVDDVVSTPNIPMNIGIVRNNIYRISIKGDGEGTLKVIVQETKWRHVDNPIIYI